MRFVHTSDWHLGKRLFEASLLEEQAHALDQIFHICRDESADALIIAGDLYDRAVPPVEAVSLLGDFLARVVADLKIPVIAISGNHDSPDRLGFASELLARGQVHLRTSLARRAEPIVVERGRRRLHVYGLPYVEPEQARSRLRDAEIVDHGSAVAASLRAVAADRAVRGGDAVLVAHLFADGGCESPESERPLLVGGASSVPAAALAGFSYVALGHLHQAQLVGEQAGVRYSGAPLKYSFGECAHEKSVTLVDLVMGRAAARTIPLVPRRDLVRIEGPFDELLRAPSLTSAEGAYVQAIYHDTGYVLDAASRLRARFPHLLQVLPRAALMFGPDEAGAPRRAMGRPGDDARGLFASFWEAVQREDAPGDVLDELERALARVREKAAEACALAS